MVFMQQHLHLKQQIYCLINWPQILNKNNFEMQGYLNFGDNLMIHADKKGTRNRLMIKDKNVFYLFLLFKSNYISSQIAGTNESAAGTNVSNQWSFMQWSSLYLQNVSTLLLKIC